MDRIRTALRFLRETGWAPTRAERALEEAEAASAAFGPQSRQARGALALAWRATDAVLAAFMGICSHRIQLNMELGGNVLDQRNQYLLKLKSEAGALMSGERFQQPAVPVRAAAS